MRGEIQEGSAYVLPGTNLTLDDVPHDTDQTPLWTPDLVTARLVAAYRLYGRHRGHPEAAAVMAWLAVYVPTDQPGRICLHLYALARAEGFPVHGESAIERTRR